MLSKYTLQSDQENKIKNFNKYYNSIVVTDNEYVICNLINELYLNLNKGIKHSKALY